MLSNRKFFILTFLLFLGITLSLLQPGSGIVNNVWSEPNALSVIKKTDPDVNNVESWGAFRGWSPSVPYGSGSIEPDSSTKIIDNPSFSEAPSPRRQETQSEKPSLTDNTSEDTGESWGAFRGWSPAVPYSN
jgi:hypothetical protein